jgi:hypothetical protein
MGILAFGARTDSNDFRLSTTGHLVKPGGKGDRLLLSNIKK